MFIKTILLITVTLFMGATVAANSVWIDVRTDSEYNEDHIEGDIHIPHLQIAEGIENLALAKNTEIILYCRSGGRAGIAKGVLESMGYTNVINIGGIGDARNNKPTELKLNNE